MESVLSSRPLAPLSNNPNDGEALTPALLLIGCPLRALPSEKLCRRRWLALRDRYGREAWKSEAPSGSGAEYQRPHVIPRPIRCSQNVCPEVASLTPSTASSMPSLLPPIVPPEEFFDDVDSPLPSTSASQSQRPSGKKRDRSTEVENDILEAIDLLKKRCIEKEN
ncbi:uncharacterized protein LOC129250599 [Anastrepha obliqua]|uniref:uncharacterized protein LOC129250599 n=1 Tax=Anastrepha obliqua TaxID=95512 RepID=UPI002409ED1A|nr:uncharacterized protein LOC129250599 [Anastrepha obliqua]